MTIFNAWIASALPGKSAGSVVVGWFDRLAIGRLPSKDTLKVYVVGFGRGRQPDSLCYRLLQAQAS